MAGLIGLRSDPGCGGHSTAAQAAVMVDALADAEAYRRDLGVGLCADCAASPDGTCQDHLEDLDAPKPTGT